MVGKAREAPTGRYRTVSAFPVRRLELSEGEHDQLAAKQACSRDLAALQKPINRTLVDYERVGELKFGLLVRGAGCTLPHRCLAAVLPVCADALGRTAAQRGWQAAAQAARHTTTNPGAMPTMWVGCCPGCRSGAPT